MRAIGRGRTGVLGLTAAVIAVMIASGCSSGASGTSASKSSGSEQSKAPSKVKLTYAVATQVLNTGYPFATLPKELGYFDKEGLDVDIVPGQSSATTLQLLASGKADIGVVVPNAAMIQTAAGTLDVKSFYAVSRQNSNAFAVNPNSPIKSVKDLKGKKLGVAALGSGANVFAHAAEDLAGVDKSSIQEVNVGYGTPAYEALKNGQVDAYTIITSFNAQAKNAGYNFRLLPNPSGIENLYSYNLYATSQFIKDHPDVIARFGRATAKATVFLQTNPEAAVKLFWKDHPDQAPKNTSDASAVTPDLNIVKAQMIDMQANDHPADFAWGSQDTATWKRMQDFLVGAQQIPKAIDPSRYFYSGQQAQYMKFDVQSVVQQAKKWTP